MSETVMSLQENVTKMPESVWGNYRMIQRKYEHFAEHNRMIITVNALDAGDEYRVAVASTMPLNTENDEERC